MAIYKKCADCGTGMWFTSQKLCFSCEMMAERKTLAEQMVREAQASIAYNKRLDEKRELNRQYGSSGAVPQRDIYETDVTKRAERMKREYAEEQQRRQRNDEDHQRRRRNVEDDNFLTTAIIVNNLITDSSQAIATPLYDHCADPDPQPSSYSCRDDSSYSSSSYDSSSSYSSSSDSSSSYSSSDSGSSYSSSD